jgi:hypothetical protein
VCGVCVCVCVCVCARSRMRPSVRASVSVWPCTQLTPAIMAVPSLGLAHTGNGTHNMHLRDPNDPDGFLYAKRETIHIFTTCISLVFSCFFVAPS